MLKIFFFLNLYSRYKVCVRGLFEPGYIDSSLAKVGKMNRQGEVVKSPQIDQHKVPGEFYFYSYL